VARTSRSTRHVAALLAGGLLLAGCGGTDSSRATSSTVPVTSTTPAPTATASASQPAAGPTPVGPSAGQPYDAAAVLDAMAASHRPGGVPAQLQQASIAMAVADKLWTFDGLPWDTVSAGGSCGPDRCTLEIGGYTAGTVGEDLYIFEVEPEQADVTVLSAELRGLPTAFAQELDTFARAHWPDAAVPGPMASARWLPPPDEGVYVVSYRSGGEENSPAVDAVVDRNTGSVTLREPG
jgi:hypothetical protein